MKQLSSSRSLVRKGLLPGIALAALALAPVAWGGLQSQTLFCQKNTDGSGHCFGNLVGFRQDAVTTSSASFRDDMVGGRLFQSYFTPAGATTHTIYSCVPDAVVGELWEQALSTRGFFRVEWDATGTCKYLRLVNGSQNTNF
ncbi:hypothetical protein OWM54_39530 [Myxococcus sp. MISCRS1]|uniref:hypothetical protein n=1 Tax=Myxococcus TaxID=32 RepID=UPI001CC10481|nr:MULTISPECIES: hypothetical protein [unclassified Myxococcus]MBZ4409087.1 hypothetical protein [Myxococcus sp. XM-1-1-1]MCY1003256.1 hypothetical protein [Myxococcus sp. MISCRS1]BDT35161.1 hypothetical protein MFMH1_48300 [Myxococcus sp. MH1]